MKFKPSNVPDDLVKSVLNTLKERGYWVRTLTELHEYFEDLQFNIVEQGTVKDIHSNYSNWTVYSSIMGTPMIRIVRIRHKYFILEI